jgi:predicted RNA-binding Zn ribbon-like protein
MDATDLPLLGEPTGIEFANTLYGSGADQFDFLGDKHLARLWLEHALVGREAAPRALSVASVASLRELRNGVHRLVVALCEASAPDCAAVALVNRHAAAGCAHAELVWHHPSPPSARMCFRGDAMARICAVLATSCIELCTGARRGAVRRCEGPGCSLLFVQHDRRRRFCHESCSHRARQRKYWRSRS